MFSSQHQEMVSGALASANSPLANVSLMAAPAAAECALSAFASLTRCDLDHPQGLLDLSALQLCPSLEDLCVSDGNFYGVPTHTAKLWASRATLKCDKVPKLPISFADLTLRDSHLYDLHDDGLLACTALTSLEINNSMITAAAQADHVTVQDQKQVSIPARLSGLTRLTNLTMVVPSDHLYSFGIDWVHSLATLQKLDLAVNGSF